LENKKIVSQTFSLQKSKELLEEQKYHVWIVEKPYNPYTKRRQDLFNFADLVGIRKDMAGVTGIQACGEDLQGHVRKILEGYTDARGKPIPPNPYLRTWLEAGNRFFIWGWTMRLRHREKRRIFEMREVEFILKDGQVIAQEVSHDEKTVPA